MASYFEDTTLDNLLPRRVPKRNSTKPGSAGTSSAYTGMAHLVIAAATGILADWLGRSSGLGLLLAKFVGEHAVGLHGEEVRRMRQVKRGADR